MSYLVERYLVLTLVYFSETDSATVRRGSRHQDSTSAVKRTAGYYVSKVSDSVTSLTLRDTRRLANDLSSYETGKYKISLVPTSPDGCLRFHLGEEIKVRWQGPYQHSRRDWIGIYRVLYPSITLAIELIIA